MRHYLSILAFLFSFSTLAQIENPRVVQISVSEGLFLGRIDTMLIQVYLNQVSGPSRIQDFSVLEGWYRTKADTNIRIEVEGIASGNSFLLFVPGRFQDTLYALIDRNYEDDYYEEPVDTWAILSDSTFNQFEERFCLIPGKRYWQRGSEKRPFMLDFDIQKLNVYEEYLQFDDRRSINLLELGMYHKGFSVMAWSDHEVLLSYFYDSRPWNPMGRCGAGFESGLCKIEFDSFGRYIGHQTYWLESCNLGIYAEYELVEDQLKLQTFNGHKEDSLGIDISGFYQEPAAILDSLRDLHY